MKRISSFCLSLCLILSAAILPVHAEQTVSVESIAAFYQHFSAVNGVCRIPADTFLEIGGSFTIEETVVIEAGAEVVFTEDAQAQVTIENNGYLELSPGAELSPLPGGSIKNNGTLNVFDGASLSAGAGTITNDGTIGLYGRLTFGVSGDQPQSRLINNGDVDCEDDCRIVILQEGEQPANVVKAVEDLRSTVKCNAIFAQARSFDELVQFNRNARIGGVFLEPVSADRSIELASDLNVTKPLWIGDCDLILPNSRALDIANAHRNLLFSRGGRIVCEAGGEGSLPGGCLILDSFPVICGVACTAAVSPVAGSVYLCADRSAENRYYPLPAQDITVGAESQAQARGVLPDVSDIGVTVEKDGVLTLCDKFSCLTIHDNGTLLLNGYTADCGVIYYGVDAQPVSGAISGEVLYELVVDPNDGVSPVSRTYAPAQDRVYLEYIDVDYDSVTDEGFLGWDITSSWNASPTVTVIKDTQEDSYDYGWHYLTMPAYPITLTAARTVQYRSGDADGDGEITVADVTAVQQWLAEIPTAPFDEAAADVDQSNDVTVLDATFLSRFLAEIATPTEIGKMISG